MLVRSAGVLVPMATAVVALMGVPMIGVLVPVAVIVIPAMVVPMMLMRGAGSVMVLTMMVMRVAGSMMGVPMLVMRVAGALIVVPIPMVMIMLVMMQELARPRPARVLAEDQRLDRDGHRARGQPNAAEVDEIEVP